MKTTQQTIIKKERKEIKPKKEKKEELIYCENCSNEIDKDEQLIFKDNPYCDNCYYELFNACDGCNNMFKNGDLEEFDGCDYCEDCIDEVSFVCEYCEERHSEGSVYWFGDNAYCVDCINEVSFCCDGCGERHSNDDMYSDNDCCYCEDCYNEDGHNSDFEEITTDFKKIHSKTFKKNKFKDYCGYEIETINDDISDNSFTFENLEKFNMFEQKVDGSLNDGGVEFVSNALNGDGLFKNIDNFCGELKDRGYYIDTSCGLHIHIQINKRCEELKKIYLFYNKFEDYFFEMVSKSREDNHYCDRLKRIYHSLDKKDIPKIKNNTEFKKLLYETANYNRIKGYVKDKWNGKRYSWLNLHSVFYRNTLEIRIHNGTIDKEKIKNWFRIHLIILNFLRGLNVETTFNLPKNKDFFLSLFDGDLKDYIKDRWVKFNREKKQELKKQGLN